MAGKLTFTMIKPNCTLAYKTGAILKMINDDGFKIKAMKMLKLTTEKAEGFYAIHKGKPFFDNLIAFMTSGPIVAILLEKEDAVESFRTLIGSTDPTEAKEGTIRKLYAETVTRNAVHGSDSDENALIEARYFFSDLDVF